MEQVEGLVKIGGKLSITSLLQAYRCGIFPWYSLGQPVLWWCPNPRMVLYPERFVLHRSLQKTLRSFIQDPKCQLSVDRSFPSVINMCANIKREKQNGTWIIPDMQSAYIALHKAGYAHSFEVWIDGNLQGGLYLVSMGKMVFGESMFSCIPNMSKIALAALVALCRRERIEMIDCQQTTKHLQSLGGENISRNLFLQHLDRLVNQPRITQWDFNPSDWEYLLSKCKI